MPVPESSWQSAFAVQQRMVQLLDLRFYWELREQMSGTPELRAHHDDFVRCSREVGTPNADIEIGHLSSSLCHLGNIATRIGRVLEFDPKHEQIVGDGEANAMLSREYRKHWGRPGGA